MRSITRLTNTFKPDKYQLSIVIDRIGRSFSGTVTMHGILMANVQYIPVHAKALKINTVLVDGKKATSKKMRDDELRIAHPDLIPGPHIVVVGFSGKITDAMNGMYPCYYEHDGDKKELIATQFESHHAREVFPCIDEPAAKATFDVTLTTEKGVTVLGNTSIKTQKVEKNKLVTQFSTTPIMSPYLLAWVVGKLHKQSAITKNGIEVNAWATPAQSPESLDFGLDIAVRTIDFFEEYFDTPYPLPKSDHIALPDFSSGAMENWGLITYREVAFIADPSTVSVSSKHYIATVIAHELAHQWFGNLVTMKWWNDLWLNESFATLMEYLAVDALEPEWNIWLDFAHTEGVIALSRDSMDGVQAVQSDVGHPDEIRTLFDGSIVYAKGARLLRMLQTYIGEEAFKKGLRNYFLKHAYQNTEAVDLWQVLTETSSKDVGGFMNAWLTQSGLPVVHVMEKDTTVTLRQERFFVGPNKPSSSLWPIPLNSSRTDLPDVLDQSVAIAIKRHKTPLRLNVGDNAYFVTHYEGELLKNLLSNLDSLSPIDRLQLMHEQTLLARSGIISSAELIPLLDTYKNTSDESVWNLMLLAINDLKKFVTPDSTQELKLKKFVGELATSQYERLGWNKKKREPETDTKLRSIIIGCVLYGELQESIDTALQLYKTTPIERLDPELRALIIGATVRHQKDTKQIVDNLVEDYRQTSSSELREDIAAGLTTIKDLDIAQELLLVSTDKDIVRPQDFIRWFFGLMRNRHSRDLAWEWARNNWDWINDTFKGDMYYDVFPRYIASNLSTQQQLDEYTSFFESFKKDPALKRNIEIGIGEIKGRIELIERDGKAVRQALNNLFVVNSD